MKFYKLDDSLQPVACESHEEYFGWHESMPDSSWWYQRKTGIGFQIRRDDVGDSIVSTIYLGLDHGLGCSGDPVLYQTMTFPGGKQERYSSWAAASHGHRAAMENLGHA